jgi:hypothetical protein
MFLEDRGFKEKETKEALVRQEMVSFYSRKKEGKLVRG